MPDGTIRENSIESDATLQIGCKVFDISRTDPLVISLSQVAVFLPVIVNISSLLLWYYVYTNLWLCSSVSCSHYTYLWKLRDDATSTFNNLLKNNKYNNMIAKTDLEAAEEELLYLLLKLNISEATHLMRVIKKEIPPKVDSRACENLWKAVYKLESLQSQPKDLVEKVKAYLTQTFEFQQSSSIGGAQKYSIAPQSVEDSYCLCCEKPAFPMQKYSCGHQACEDCAKKSLREALGLEVPVVLTCPIKNCRHALTLYEQKLVDKKKQSFYKGSIREGMVICGICKEEFKRGMNIIRLHSIVEGEEHSLCTDCIKIYANEVTDGKVYVAKKGGYKKYCCPFLGCMQKFGFGIVKAVFDPEENKKLFALADKLCQ
eukprot:TRINITY_DN2663_c0_g1_i1.p2 TRINITY_DN2663_c0_g1~~TRINITY_DN2663_c0_g1_i1.p2  ORF type:complete len:373 (+),score=30.54 TRINITY_DN2663_c0_g1_i1:1560-2678(+)